MGASLSSGDQLPQPFKGTGGRIHALILGLEYKYAEPWDLSSRYDAAVMLDVVRGAGVPDEDITVVLDDPTAQVIPTRESIFRYIQAVSRNAVRGDWFMFYYAGHGVNVPDDRWHDEVDGQDEAFVLPSRRGELEVSQYLVDDDFARGVDQCVPEGVRILVITDCCHSRTIADVDSYAWSHEIFAMSAADDDELADDTGQGGVFTTCLAETLRELCGEYGGEEFSIQDVMETLKEKVDEHPSKEDMRPDLQYRSWNTPDEIAWPLCETSSRFARRRPVDVAQMQAELERSPCVRWHSHFQVRQPRPTEAAQLNWKAGAVQRPQGPKKKPKPAAKPAAGCVVS